MDVIVGRTVAWLGVAVMTAAGVNAHHVSLVALTALGCVVLVLGLVCYWRALPPTRWREPQPGSPWRFPVAAGAVTLAMALAAAPLLVALLGAHRHLWLPVGCVVVLVQAWVVARLDRTLGRFGHRPRRRFALSLVTSSVATMTAAGLLLLLEDPDLLRWPALVNAAVVVVVTAAGSLFSRSSGSTRAGGTGPAHGEDADRSGATGAGRR